MAFLPEDLTRDAASMPEADTLLSAKLENAGLKEAGFYAHPLLEELRNYLGDIEPFTLTAVQADEIVAGVKTDWEIGEKEHPFGRDRGISSLLSGVIKRANNGTLDDAIRQHAYEEMHRYHTHHRLSEPWYAPVERKDREAVARQIFDTLGQGLEKYKEVTQPYTKDTKAAIEQKESPEGKIAFWKPLAVLLGAVGLAYAVSPSKEEQHLSTEDGEPKGQGWFKPVLKWLGIAVAAVSAIELGASLMNRSSPIVGPATARLFNERNTTSATAKGAG